MKKILKHKKKIFIACTIFVVLFVCYLIGQNIVLPSRLKKEGLATFDGNVPKYSFVQNFELVEYPDAETRDDVPGGSSASYMVLDGNQKVFFFIPGAKISQELLVENQYSRMSFACGYHPSIQEGIADGANVNVEIVDTTSGDVLFTDKIEIEDVSAYISEEIDLTKYRGMTIKVEFSCDSGKNGDESGDWIVIKNWAID